ncbi:MAG: hypothetical protein GXP01_04750 [Alphaproteobacteria bacterium]|nr:hypothetical protein [Alphaproteobacteria bacterium]
MNFKLGGILAATSVVASIFAVSPAAAQDTQCGTDRLIDIAEMTWESASVLANLHQIVLTEGFGCKSELVPGDTVTTSASMMGRGKPAVAPELWMSSIEDKWDAAESEGLVAELGLAITDGTLEGLWIPRWMQDEYGLSTMEDVLARSDLFPDPESPGKARVFSGPPGWVAELAVSSLYEAYDMGDNWNLFSVADSTLAASIKRAFEKKDPILFYYWSPASIMGQVDAVKVGLPAYDQEVYNCNTDVDCDGFGKTDWPSSRVVVGVASWLPEEAPAVADYLTKAGMPGAVISELAAYGDENSVSSRETAMNFLRTREDVWTDWVPEDVAGRIRAAL